MIASRIDDDAKRWGTYANVADVYRDTRWKYSLFHRSNPGKFIDSWYLANEIVSSGHKNDAWSPTPCQGRSRGTTKAARTQSGYPRLAVNPLLLTMVCMVHRYHGALPGSRSQLYGEICQVLLERWRQAREARDELREIKSSLSFVLSPNRRKVP
jgi:predicted NACHT family NTPase